MRIWQIELGQRPSRITKSTRQRWAVGIRMLPWTRHLIWIFSTSTIKREMTLTSGHNIIPSRLQRSSSRSNRPPEAIRRNANRIKCKKLRRSGSSQGTPFRISWSSPRAIFQLADQKAVIFLSTWPITRAASCAGSHSPTNRTPCLSKSSAVTCNATVV